MKITVRLTNFPSNVYRHLHDAELAERRVRNNNGDVYAVPRFDPAIYDGEPEVFPLDREVMPLTDQWQFYLCAINHNMLPSKVAALLGDNKAFCNNTGFGDPDTPRRNYITGENLTSELPKFSSTFTCGGSLLSGVVSNGMIAVVTMDGNSNPPIKPGRFLPVNVNDAISNRDSYLYLPETHPYMFHVAVNVSNTAPYNVFPFANGGYYSFTPDRRMYSFLPLVSRKPILYPADRVERVGSWVSPYTV